MISIEEKMKMASAKASWVSTITENELLQKEIKK